MILEGVVTSLNENGDVNIAPMGPIVDESMTVLRLRPFQTSTTFRNLQRDRHGVFHVVDDVLLLAQAAVNKLEHTPPTFAAEMINGRILQSACRWYEFAVDEIDDSHDRAELLARVVHCGRIRDFFGLNRAKHAVLEAAILATRVHLLPKDEITQQYAALKILVDKTAGATERKAFALLEEFVNNSK